MVSKILFFHSMDESDYQNKLNTTLIRINIIENINRIKYQNQFTISHKLLGDYISSDLKGLQNICNSAIDAQNANVYIGDGCTIERISLCRKIIADVEEIKPDIIFIHFGTVFQPFIDTFLDIFSKIKKKHDIIISFDQPYAYLIQTLGKKDKPFNRRIVNKLRLNECREVFNARKNIEIHSIWKDFCVSNIKELKEDGDRYCNINIDNFTLKLKTAIDDSELILSYNGMNKKIKIENETDIKKIGECINDIDFLLLGYSQELKEFEIYFDIHYYKNLLFSICKLYDLIQNYENDVYYEELSKHLFSCYFDIRALYPSLKDSIPVILNKPVVNFERIKKTKKIVLIFYSQNYNLNSSRIATCNRDPYLEKYYFKLTYFADLNIRENMDLDSAYEIIKEEIVKKNPDIILVHMGQSFVEIHKICLDCLKKIKKEYESIQIGIQNPYRLKYDNLINQRWHSRNAEITLLLNKIFQL